MIINFTAVNPEVYHRKVTAVDLNLNSDLPC